MRDLELEELRNLSRLKAENNVCLEDIKALLVRIADAVDPLKSKTQIVETAKENKALKEEIVGLKKALDEAIHMIRQKQDPLWRR